MSKRYGFRDILIRKTKTAKILMITKDFGFLISFRLYLLCFLKGELLLSCRFLLEMKETAVFP